MDRRHSLLRSAFVLILVGYLLEWLPHAAAGLSIMGQELGEWVKFVPAVKGGEVIFGRGYFFIPPWTLALMLVSWTIPWSNRRVQTWFVRIIAILISFLIFPPFEVIRFEEPNQWLVRILMILSVMTYIFSVPLIAKRPIERVNGITSISFVVLGIFGAVLPTSAYLAVRAPISDLLGAPVGMGMGILLNLTGHLMVLAYGLRYMVGSSSDIPGS